MLEDLITYLEIARVAFRICGNEQLAIELDLSDYEMQRLKEQLEKELGTVDSQPE